MKKAEATITPSELLDSDVSASLAYISVDSDMYSATETEQMLDDLTLNQGIQVLTKEMLQDWLWEEVPTKMRGLDHQFPAIAAKLMSNLFDDLELYEYAEVCRSERTKTILNALTHERHDSQEQQ